VTGSRPTVVFVSEAEEFAGAEHYMVLIMEALADRFDFLVVAGKGAADETLSKSENAGGRTMVIGGLRRKPSLSAQLELTRLLRRTSPDLVHVNASDQGSGVATFIASRFVAAPLVATLHNKIPLRSRAREFVSRAMLRTSDQIIAVSDGVGGYLERLDLKHVVVKNGLLPPRIDPLARKRLGLEPDAFVVGGIGRLHHQKGWDVLCAAAPAIRAQRPDIQIIVVGDGPLREELKRMHGSDEVRFEGYTRDASSLLGAFDLLVMPSRYEGLGLVAIEGMFSGIPIVASKVDGLVEVIGETGRLVPPEAPDLLADAIVDMASNRRGREDLAALASERARRLFHRDRMAEQTAAVYESLIASKPWSPAVKTSTDEDARLRGLSEAGS
jgi:glycosyltransferase involved in cell wall biosynthesis